MFQSSSYTDVGAGLYANQVKIMQIKTRLNLLVNTNLAKKLEYGRPSAATRTNHKFKFEFNF